MVTFQESNHDLRSSHFFVLSFKKRSFTVHCKQASAAQFFFLFSFCVEEKPTNAGNRFSSVRVQSPESSVGENISPRWGGKYTRSIVRRDVSHHFTLSLAQNCFFHSLELNIYFLPTRHAFPLHANFSEYLEPLPQYQLSDFSIGLSLLPHCFQRPQQLNVTRDSKRE